MRVLAPLLSKPRPKNKRQTESPSIDLKGLEKSLREALRGEVLFEAGDRALYATDASNYRQVPLGVVRPRSAQDIEETLRVCREFGAPVVSRGGGTSLAGQTCNVAVVMDMERHYNRLLSIDPERRLARVQPGIVLDDLRAAAARKGLTFGPDPATHRYCTIGGMIGNNACGMHAQMAGSTAMNVESLEVLTYGGLRLRVGATSDAQLERLILGGGEIGALYRGMRDLRDRYAGLIRERYPDIPRRVSGLNLDELLPERGFNVARALVGSEGTLVTVLEATLRLIPNPPARSLLVLGYPDVFAAGDHLPRVLEAEPIALEGMDDQLIEAIRRKGLVLESLPLLPEGKGWLVLEFGGETREEANEKARRLMESLRQETEPPSMSLFDHPEQERLVWEARESGLGATARVPGEPDAFPGWEDAAVPVDQMGPYLRDFRALLDRFGYRSSLYGHFGQGCIHCRISFDLSDREGVSRYREFAERAAALVVKYGGSFSGEHGDGQARAELLPKMFGEELVRGMREFKGLWDPLNRMNPRKVIEPYRLDENLRLGPEQKAARPDTHFKFPEDDGKFDKAVTRCVGVGLCRRTEGGTMCPSYMVTREERHSTRGRAHLLYEMLNGELIGDGWKSEAVKDALDLCLSCKGCKSDCPINVDMATYKAEFLSHYYEGRLRPRRAFAFGLIMVWARIASHLPRLANTFTQTPPFDRLAKWAAEVHPGRSIPAFAAESFQRQVRDRESPVQKGREVILFPDTFNNYFHPLTGQSALEVLEAAGFRPRVPQGFLCCGRPLYEYGMIGVARSMLERVLRRFSDEIASGMPFVVLEPSCAAVFRDELKGLFPEDANALRLSKQTFTLSEFLEKYAKGLEVPALKKRALVQGHCHQRSVLDFDSEVAVLKKAGLEVEVPESGCCGMAGAFGFEKGKYDVSQACGERNLLPSVRQAAGESLIVADGFSCREQIAQGSSRRGLHLAEVLRFGLRKRAGEHPEEALSHVPARPFSLATLVGTALGASAVALGVVSAQRRRSGLWRALR